MADVFIDMSFLTLLRVKKDFSPGKGYFLCFVINVPGMKLAMLFIRRVFN